jgi:alkanesulfonate monooxygenase SsuD/methylene tetrahydromethanopterin reductase-like flavin-dependent oxidoreductase (luciferase family)
MTPGPGILNRPTRIGLLTLVDHLPEPGGERISRQQRLDEVMAGAILAEEVGFERFAVGEHHFSDYILSNPSLLLAAIAASTTRLRLMTAVTLLPCRDPVQTAEDIGILDIISNGRLELSFARGVSEEASRAFDVPREHVYAILEEKLDLLLFILGEGHIPSGHPQGGGLPVIPRAVQSPHPPIWIGGGLSVESTDLAVSRGLPLILPSLFRYPEDYLPMIDRYRDGMRRAGRADRIRVALPSHFWVERTSQEARQRFRPYLERYVAFARQLRDGFGRPLDFEGLIGGPAICGSPAEVVDRISAINERLGLDVHLLKMDAGGVPFTALRRCMELAGSEVLPHFAGVTRDTPAP